MNESLIKQIVLEEVDRLINEDVDFQQLQLERDYLYGIYEDISNKVFGDSNADGVNLSVILFLEELFVAMDKCISSQSLDEAWNGRGRSTFSLGSSSRPSFSKGQHLPSRIANGIANAIGGKDFGPTSILQAGLRGFANGYDRAYNATYDELTRRNAESRQKKAEQDAAQQNQGQPKQSQEQPQQDDNGYQYKNKGQMTLKYLMGGTYDNLKYQFTTRMPEEYQHEYYDLFQALDNLKNFVNQNN